MAENRTLKYHASSNNTKSHSSIMRLTIEDNNFEPKPSLVSMVKQNLFFGLPMDDQNLHFSKIL